MLSRSVGSRLHAFLGGHEQRLFAEHLGPLDDLSIMKTDLWDETRNTRMMVWARERGARTFGVDISVLTEGLAHGALGATTDAAVGVAPNGATPVVGVRRRYPWTDRFRRRRM